MKGIVDDVEVFLKMSGIFGGGTLEINVVERILGMEDELEFIYIVLACSFEMDDI